MGGGCRYRPREIAMRFGWSPDSCRRTDLVRRTQLGAVLLLLLALPPPGLANQVRQGPRLGVTDSRGRNPAVLLRELPGLRHAFATVRHDLHAFFGDQARAERMLGSEAERDAALAELPPARRAREAKMYPRAVARWAEFERLVAAVAGTPGEDRGLAYRDVSAAFVAGGQSAVLADPGALARDRFVLSMAMSGYGPGLIADVVTGRLTIQVVEEAARRRLLGHTDAEVARYLEANAVVRAAVHSPATAGTAFPGRAVLDRTVVRHARRHGVDPRLVRAVITHESAWNSDARSPKGAIGLMQLMPDTARLLGVDPTDLDENIAGGIHYLADLRALFDGNLDAVLVAYVAGPAYAQRWLRDRTMLPDEVRAYIDKVKASYWR